MKTRMNWVAPACTCCAQPTPLLPRDDLAPGMAVCSATGQLYRPEGTGYVPAPMPQIATRQRPTTGVRIDLSRAGYA
jgi:hypothetical protein